MKLGQKSVKNLVGFLGGLKTPKFHSEINWPLKESTILNMVIEFLQFLSTKTNIFLSALVLVETRTFVKTWNTNPINGTILKSYKRKIPKMVKSCIPSNKTKSQFSMMLIPLQKHFVRWSTCVIFIKKKITVYKAVQIKLGY